MPSRFGRGERMSTSTGRKKTKKVAAPTGRTAPMLACELTRTTTPRREWKRAAPIVAQAAYQPLNLDPSRLPK